MNKFEVIICDNNSSDSTFEVAERYKNSFLNFSYIKTQSPGLHVGRNVGYKAAKGDILVYCDDDILPLPTWLDAILDSFKDDDVMLVGGNNLPNWEIEPTDWALEMWEPNSNGERVIGCFSLIHLGDQKKEISPFQVFGCNFSV
jgi:glycosyltransferase involved in cell wall biosynthesis